VAATGAGEAVSTAIQVPAGGLVIRGRGCRTIEDGPGLCFYTNPVRMRTR
jgi:hypothetical protein